MESLLPKEAGAKKAKPKVSKKDGTKSMDIRCLFAKKNRERGAKKRQFSANFRLVTYMPAKHVHKLFIEGDNTICKVKNGNYC